jgi:hypothetical protein
MRAQVLCVLVLAGVGPLSGCRTKQDSLDECLQDRIRLTNKMVAVLEAVTEDSDAAEVRSSLEALLEEQEDIDRREQKLKKDEVTQETAKRLATKEREELAESLTNLEKAREQAMKCNPEVAEVLKELDLPRLPPKLVPDD